jgi:hypothetical protein
MRKAISTLLICIIFIGCKKDKICDCVMPYQIYYLQAKLTQTSDISCHLPVLDFSEDSVRIRNITGLTDLTFTAKYLPAGLVIQGQKMYVSVTTLPQGENPACNALGIPYPAIKVVDAKPRN